MVSVGLAAPALLKLAAVVPLISIAFAHVLSLVKRANPEGRNPFQAPIHWEEEEEPTKSGQRGWKHWLMGSVGAAQATAWAIYSVKSGVQDGVDEWEWTVSFALVSVGWVSTATAPRECGVRPD